MLDAKLIRAKPDMVRAALARRGYAEAVDELLELDERRRELLARVESVRAERNTAARSIADAKRRGDDASVAIARQSALKEELGSSEAELDQLEAHRAELLRAIPNLPDPSAPDGSSEEDAETVRVVGEPPAFDFPPRDHLDLAGPEGLGLIDMETGARTAGSRFHYLLGDLVLVEMALMRWGMLTVAERGYLPVLPPVLARREAMFGTGFFPTDEQQVYAIPEDDLYLVGTAEVPLAAFNGETLLAADELPRRFAGLSDCFRREAGAAGRDTRGIFRVHQFQKLELFVVSHPERSGEEHERLLALEEELAQALGFHYRVQNIAAGDLGAQAAKKYDIEVWLPGQSRFRELTSCSNCTDYQARRLNARFREDGKPALVHMLNGTALTSSRTLLALIEYGQHADGSVTVPEILQAHGAPARLRPRP
jgi:seryl-tRNA synthetase